MSRSKLPLGIQDLSELINGGYRYVDKTPYLYEMIKTGKHYLISRPRRFGKSLTVSTLEAFFLGKRELFEGLWIDSSDWDWQVYPVIRLDMGKVDSSTPLEFVQSLTDQLCKIADQYHVTLPTELPIGSIFDTLILKLSEFGKVVVLADEYDKPLIDQLADIT